MKSNKKSSSFLSDQQKSPRAFLKNSATFTTLSTAGPLVGLSPLDVFAAKKPVDAIGPLKVKVKLPKSVAGRNIQSLVSKSKLSAIVAGGFAQFEIKSILDHEVVVIS